MRASSTSRNRGYGSALSGGIAAARGRYVIMGDADDTYDFGAIGPFVEKLREGYDLVMGNRFQGGIDRDAMPALHRYLGNPVLTGIGRLLFRSPVGDFHCGLRGFTGRGAIGSISGPPAWSSPARWSSRQRCMDMRVTEVPTTLSQGAPQSRPASPNLARRVAASALPAPLQSTLAVPLPRAVPDVVGLIGMLWLVPGVRVVGNVGFDVQSLLFAAVAIVVGYQAVVFAVFTKIFAVNEGLLPRTPGVDRVFRHMTLEVGLLGGGIVLLAGIAGSILAFLQWSDVSFGDLDPTQTLRIIIPSITALIVGFETILASFFLSVLGLKRR